MFFFELSPFKMLRYSIILSTGLMFAITSQTYFPTQSTDIPSYDPSLKLLPSLRNLTSQNASSSVLALNESVANLTFGKLQCSEDLFGRPEHASCTDAYDQMGESLTPQLYGDRNGPIEPGIPLPLRFSSCG